MNFSKHQHVQPDSHSGVCAISRALRAPFLSSRGCNRALIAATLAALFGLLWQAESRAQDSPGADQPRQLEEIMVTAQKREESLQDVPISISVVGGEELRALSIFDFAETAQLTPGVNFSGGGVQSGAIRLRGVGPPYFALTSPQSVAVFIDEIAQGSIGAAFSTLVDVERIELLRGPQGTLYGQNAPSGVYNISTRTPNTTDFEGYVESSYAQQNSSSLDSVDVRGAVNLPVVEDVVGVRLAGVYADSDGFIKVKNPNNPDDSAGGKNHGALRSRVLWQINADMDLLWTSNYQDLTDYGAGSNGNTPNIEGIVPGTGGANPLPAIYTKFDDRVNYGDVNSEATTNTTDTAVHWRWDREAVDIDFLASWQDFKTYTNENRDPFPGFTSVFEIQLDWTTTTSELRFSNESDKFDYIAGLYYSKRDIDGFFDLVLTGVQLNGPAVGGLDSKAAYTNVTFHLTDTWDLTTGARYDMNDVWTESDFEFIGLHSVVDDEASYDHLSWSFKLSHFFNENLTGYIAIDNAYKHGGFNNLVPGALVLAPLLPDLSAIGEEMLAFDEETTNAFEIGLKGVTEDGSLGYNAAIFYQEFNDHQLLQPYANALVTPLGDFNSLFINQLVNADKILTQGVEFDITYLLNENWDTGLRVAYFDATIEDWPYRFCPPGEEQAPNQILCPSGGDGEPLTNQPQWNTNFQLGYTHPLTASLEFSSRLNWTWQSSPNFTGATKDYANPKSTLDFNMGITSQVTGLGLRLWGKNLTNEDLNVDPFVRYGGDPTVPLPWGGGYFPGRQYGLTVSYNF